MFNKHRVLPVHCLPQADSAISQSYGYPLGQACTAVYLEGNTAADVDVVDDMPPPIAFE